MSNVNNDSHVPEYLADELINTIKPYLADELINMNIAKWSGTLEQYKEDFLRSTPGMYEAAFCNHNQVIAAKQVLEGEFSCYPVFSKNKGIQMEKMIEAAKILVTETEALAQPHAWRLPRAGADE